MKHIVKLLTDAVQGKPVHLRSSKWSGVRKNFLKDNPTCCACGGIDKLEVHHKQPFHLHPELELDPTNLITLCESDTKCHLQLGHLGDWHKFNPSVERDVKKYFKQHQKGK